MGGIRFPPPVPASLSCTASSHNFVKNYEKKKLSYQKLLKFLGRNCEPILFVNLFGCVCGILRLSYNIAFWDFLEN